MQSSLRASCRAHPLALVFAISLMALVGCGEERTDVREWRPEDHQQPTNADPSRRPADERQQADPAQIAATMWMGNCASCHGRDGRGRGPGLPPGASVPDLTSAAYHQGRSNQQIAEAITRGRGMMPGFGARLPARAIAQLVRHVRRLRRGGSPATDPSGRGASGPSGNQ